jgi:16S rRNA processing protein RimM
MGIFFSLTQMNNSDYFQIGLIKKPHGLKGDVHFSLDGVINLEEVPALFIEFNGQLVPHFIESYSGNGDKLIVKFEDINSVEDAKGIGGKKAFLQKSVRPGLPEGEFYDDEIIGFEVTDETSGLLGILDEIITAGANRLLVVRKESGEVLIPENGPFIKEINKAQKTILVNLPEGFLEMNN